MPRAGGGKGGAMLARRLFLALIVVLAAGPAAFGADKVQLRLDWVFGSEHAPIFLAKEKGFFAAEGIDIELLPGEGSTVTVKLVGNGTTAFGYAGADQVLMAAGRDLPVVSLAVILQKSPSAIIFPASSGIITLQDLYGRRLGVQLRSNTEKQWRAVEEINHLDKAKISEVPADRAIAQLLENKTIDAGVAFYFNDGLKLVAGGLPMKWILFSDAGLPIYSTALITNGDMIKEHPDLVRRFTRAFIKGWTYSLAHPQEALEIFLKANPTIDPKYSALKLPEVLKLTQSQDVAEHGIGYSTADKWNAMQQALLAMGAMTEKADVTKAFTNDFLK
jgi:NitT/TauT family transport system substrate-binding protein